MVFENIADVGMRCMRDASLDLCVIIFLKIGNVEIDACVRGIHALENLQDGGRLGCNPTATAIEAALGSATYTDNCGPTTATALGALDGSVISSGCSRSQTRTWNVSDVCGNAAITVSRKTL